jgi:flagellar biogenesis protein FliO
MVERQDEEPSWAAVPRLIAAQAEPARKLGSSSAPAPAAGAIVGWTLVVLALAAGLALAARRLLRRSGLLGGDGPIRVLARKLLAPRQELLVVEVGRRVFLIGSTRERLSTLGELSRADVGDGPAETEFRATLRESIREAEAPKAAPAEPMSQIAGEIAEIRKTVEGWRA